MNKKELLERKATLIIWVGKTPTRLIKDDVMTCYGIKRQFQNGTPFDDTIKHRLILLMLIFERNLITFTHF